MIRKQYLITILVVWTMMLILIAAATRHERQNANLNKWIVYQVAKGD